MYVSLNIKVCVCLYVMCMLFCFEEDAMVICDILEHYGWVFHQELDFEMTR